MVLVVVSSSGTPQVVAATPDRRDPSRPSSDSAVSQDESDGIPAGCVLELLEPSVEPRGPAASTPSGLDPAGKNPFAYRWCGLSPRFGGLKGTILLKGWQR